MQFRNDNASISINLNPAKNLGKNFGGPTPYFTVKKRIINPAEQGIC